MSKLIIFCLIICMYFQISAQEQERSSLAFEALQKKDYATAEKLFSKEAEKKPKDYQAWLYIGISQVNQKNLKKGIMNIEKAYDLSSEGRSRNEVRFVLAKYCLIDGKKENTLKYLNELANNNAGNFFTYRIKQDSVFNKITNEPDVIKIFEKMSLNSQPCLSDPNYKLLDFWIGTWNVYIKDGGKEYDSKVATDSIVKAPGGCSVLEFFNMFSPNKYFGRSFSFYDDVKKVYRHQWAGSAGDIVNYEVTKSVKDTLVLIATTTQPGKKNEFRLRKMTMVSYLSEQAVWQYIENFSDQDKIWKVEWDALYRRN